MKRTTLIALGGLILSFAAQAASFNCTKAQTRVEHIICDNTEISKLDEEMTAEYKAALRDQAQAEVIRRSQKLWIKERNGCANASCVKQAYQDRLQRLIPNPMMEPNQAKLTQQVAQQGEANSSPAQKERYTSVTSKDNELCNHMLKLFNADLKKYGWNGDAHQEEHEEFKRVPWEPARFSAVIDGRAEYTDVEGALFDFNNDGVQDFVVRWKAMLSNARADLLFMLNSEVAKRKMELTSSELWNSENQIDIAGHGYSSSTPPEVMVDSRVLEPFIYRGTSYLVMRELFEGNQTIGGYAVITKYGGGKFINQKMVGKMEDICYYQRIGAKRKN